LAGRFRLGTNAWAGVLLSVILGSTACGYRAAYGGSDGRRYEVVAGHYATSSFEAVQAAVAGVRSELGAAQALGSGFPRVVVEVLRVDERSIGVGSTSNDVPLARGSEVVVVGRAQVFESESAAATIDSGDISRAAQYASGATPSADAAARAQAVRDAARSVGRALGQAVLGLPVPAEG
jgi:hypothetical protein